MVPGAISQLGGRYLRAAKKFCVASPHCRRLFKQEVRRAASRTLCTAGISRPTRIPMIATTTSNSINVNADRLPA
jgi:hypothetical protein